MNEMTETKDTATTTPDDNLNIRYDSRESILSNLDNVIEILYKKTTKGRIKNPDNDKVRIQWFRVLAYTCSIYNQIKRDIDLDELKEEIEALREEIRSMK